MKIGKVTGNVYKRSVLKEIHNDNTSGTVLGEDCAVFLSEPMELYGISFVRTAVYRALNALLMPMTIRASLMLPAETEESCLKELIREIGSAAKEAGVRFAGAEVKVTASLRYPVLSLVSTGDKKLSEYKRSAEICDGYDIVLTKWIGLSGTAITAAEKKTALKDKFPTAFLEDAEALSQFYSIIPEAATAVKSGALKMKPVTEGGIFAALWELAEECGVGLEIELKKIPLKQETVEVCEFFGISPYELYSDGCLLLIAEDGEESVRLFSEENISATVIGKVRSGNDRVVINDEEKRYLEPAKPDALYQIYA
ncbi:MAG: hydrogenase maturation factor [Lachnospiraceae bacterium]|nr:hydrogenase maturation factor [Lachnospiraceae bacterium]